ncbi:MAG TPA: isoamylase early set domain-containing protein [Vicinamibacterales bacterium]|nr:isoamylase early set domain-containing protein [Vicinamibacterales bacterium]
MRLSLVTAVASMLTVTYAACASTIVPAAPVTTHAGVRFVFERAGARSVSLAGSFNRWSLSSHPLVRQNERGLWAIVVPLERGEHTFMYVVNGTEWVSPPLAEDYVDDGFGARNGIVVVR